jgi:hypothetical protein
MRKKQVAAKHTKKIKRASEIICFLYLKMVDAKGIEPFRER